MKTFGKLEFFGAVGISLLGGMAIGYSKAREICLEAMINAMPDTKQKDFNENEKETET